MKVNYTHVKFKNVFLVDPLDKIVTLQVDYSLFTVILYVKTNIYY